MIKEYNIYAEAKKSTEDLFDFKDCLHVETKYNNLKKWVRYKAVNYGDADQVLKTAANRDVLLKMGWPTTDYIDCIFSVKTFFNAFLRFYLDNEIPCDGELLDYFDEYFSKESLQKFAKEKNIDEIQLKEMMIQLDSFAKNTHTFGNYMPCPDEKYNSIKGFGKGYEYFQDRIELLFKELDDNKYSDYINESTRTQWQTWFKDNKDNNDNLLLDSMLNNKILLKYKCPSRKGRDGVVFAMEEPDDITEYASYLKEVNSIIENRTKLLMKKVKEL